MGPYLLIAIAVLLISGKIIHKGSEILAEINTACIDRPGLIAGCRTVTHGVQLGEGGHQTFRPQGTGDCLQAQDGVTKEGRITRQLQ